MPESRTDEIFSSEYKGIDTSTGSQIKEETKIIGQAKKEIIDVEEELYGVKKPERNYIYARIYKNNE